MDLKFTVDFDIDTFEFWGPACQVVEQLRKEDLLEDASVLIEAAFEGETPTATQINDYVWLYLEDDLLEIYDKLLWPESWNKSSED
jgi:hypothetical protein